MKSSVRVSSGSIRATRALRRMRPALGTFVEIRLAGPYREEILQREIESAYRCIARVEALMSFHSESSDLTRLNRAPVGRWIRVHAWTAQVLRRSLALQRDSEGAFDVAIADSLVAHGKLPGRPRAARTAQKSGCASFEVQGLQVRRTLARRIDLGGIAKGFAVDQAVAGLSRKLPGGSGLVNAGGDLRKFGSNSARVHIRMETSDLPLLKSRPILLRSAALATSYGRSDKVLSSTGKIFQGTQTVTLLAQDCMTADALTKVALMASPAVLRRCLKKYQASLV